ncbi:MAG: alpha/beta hydrolase family protein, partial [Acidimicrobiales bacterium]
PVPRKTQVLAVTVLALGLLAGACSGANPAAVPDRLPPAPSAHQYTAFAGNGPYRAGVAFEMTSKGDPVVVYFPVDPASVASRSTYTINLLRWFTGSPTAPIPAGLPLNLPTTLATDAYFNAPISARGPFPVVMFSHGYGGYPEQSSFLTDHLATWGFVVVAPDHRSRDLKAVVTGTTGRGQNDVADLRDALAMVRSMNSTPGTLLSHKVDLSRVASLGHSAGGGAAITLADDADIRTYVALAPSPGVPPPSKPGLIMQGSADKIVPLAGTRKVYAGLASPKRLVVIQGAGHNVFADACTIGEAQGGLAAFIAKLKLPAQFAAIATDGCTPPDLAPPRAWPLIDQVVTAQLRWGLGIDRSPVGLGPQLLHAFSGVTALVSSRP